MFNPGRETQVKALGRTWTVGRLELRVVRAFKEWVKAQLGDPFAELERLLPHLPPEEVARRLKAVDDDRRQLESFTVGCDLARRFLSSDEGMAELFFLLLEPRHPNVTREEAYQVALELGREAAGVLEQANGTPPGNGAPPAPGAAGRGKSTGTRSTGD